MTGEDKQQVFEFFGAEQQASVGNAETETFDDDSVEVVTAAEQIAAETAEQIAAETAEQIAAETAEQIAAEEESVSPAEKRKKQRVSRRAKNRVVNTVIHVVLAVICVVWILPFIGILLESFRCESTGLAGYIIPKKWGFDNYVRLFTGTLFPRWFGSTLLMGLTTAVVQTVFQLSVAFVLSRFRFKGRKFLMNLILVFGMFPGFLTLILLYTWMHDWNLTDANAPYGLMIIYVASSGMGYYIAKGFFDTISKSLDEAARVDGASRMQIFFKLILPLSKPIVIYTILMGFMAPWGDFVMATFMANSASAGYNVAAGLQWLIIDSMKNDYYTTFCAGGVVVALPITILFMCLQKYYVAGVTGGAVKG